MLREEASTKRPPVHVNACMSQLGCASYRLFAAQTKTYHIFEEDGEPILQRAEGTDVEWKPGKNPTVKVRLSFPRSLNSLTFVCGGSQIAYCLDMGRAIYAASHREDHAVAPDASPSPCR